jgi:hypothetical protein
LELDLFYNLVIDWTYWFTLAARIVSWILKKPKKHNIYKKAVLIKFKAVVLF